MSEFLCNARGPGGRACGWGKGHTGPCDWQAGVGRAPGPLRPREVAALKKTAIPAVAIEAFNELILENICDGAATFTQESVVKRILRGVPEGQLEALRSAIFADHWLDVEDAYRAEGWDVTYDKPGYNESYSATFTFRMGVRR